MTEHHMKLIHLLAAQAVRSHLEAQRQHQSKTGQPCTDRGVQNQPAKH